jgi:hypothetical protein
MYLLTVAAVLATTAAAVVLMAGRTLAAPRRHRPVAASAPTRQAPKRREDFTLAA